MPSLERPPEASIPPGAIVVGRNSALLIGGNLVARFAAFATTIIIVRRLSTNDFATIVIAQAVVAYLAIALDFGLTLAGIRDVARDRRRAQFIVGSVVATRFVIGAIGLAVIGLAGVVVSLSGEMAAVITLFAVAAALAAFDLSWVLQGIEEMRPRAIVLAGTALLNFGLVAVFLLLAPSPIVVPVAQVVATGALVAIVGTIILKRIGRPRWAGLRSLSILVVSAVPLGVGSLAAQVYYNFDLLLLGVIRSQREVAAYGAVYKIVFGLLMLAGMYGVAFLPRYAAAHVRANGSLERSLRRNVRLLALVAVPVAVGGTVFARPIVDIVFGQTYEEGAQPLAILLWSVVVAFMSSPVVYALVASGRGWLVTGAAVAAAIVNVGLNLVLIPRFGMIGAAASTVAAEVVLLFVVVARGHLVSWATFGDLSRLVPPAGAMAVALILASDLPGPLALGIGAAAYGLTVLVTGAWTKEDRAVLGAAIAYIVRQRHQA